jgi:hypothetical protein
MKPKDLNKRYYIPYGIKDPLFQIKNIEEPFLVEMKIIEVAKDEFHPEGIKYSLVAIDIRTGKRVLGFDNHERKGHHMHIMNKEKEYEFIDEWKLIEDFNNELEKLKRKIK